MLKEVLIIAEAGVNHNGSLELAKEMIKEASLAKASYIKFQTFKASSLVSFKAEMADYQKKNLDSVEQTQYEMLKKLEFTKKDFIELHSCCQEHNIKFLSSPFDLESIDLLKGFQMDFWKIPSGEITNYPYLVKIGKQGGWVVLSTGMSDLEEIRAAINVLKDAGTEKITLLQCNTDYPTKYKDVNLQALKTFKKEFNVEVGYSDHTLGIEVSLAAVALGATIIEKHFTLDKDFVGPDHKASLDSIELKKLVKSIRNIEEALGSQEKKASDSEKKNLIAARKSIVAKRPIAQGEKFTEENITTKRPGSGLSPMKWEEVLSGFASKSFDENEEIVL